MKEALSVGGPMCEQDFQSRYPPINTQYQYRKNGHGDASSDFQPAWVQQVLNFSLVAHGLNQMGPMPRRPTVRGQTIGRSLKREMANLSAAL